MKSLSSSHTLIGGFAGAAITHAIIKQGGDISWAKIVDGDTIIKTVMFIFLAPLIGMAISIFITLVTIYQNIWIRLGIIAIATGITVMMFDRFEENKMDEENVLIYEKNGWAFTENHFRLIYFDSNKKPENKRKKG